MTKNKAVRAGSFAVAAMLAASCGWVPATDINRVQPNYVSKDLFKGEWYARSMVVDKQYTNAWVFTGLEGNLERVRWEITRHNLNAYRSYQGVPGTEDADVGEQTLIASFPIDSHFDIRRQYNPNNGVETNVIEENTEDRPWYERDYIRVDWRQNTAPYMPLFGIDLTDAINNNSGYIVDRNTGESDPTERFKVRVSNDYIETTVDALMQPDMYSCYDLGPELFNCQAAQVRLKYSFLRRDSSHNAYDPAHFPDRVNQQYGFKENVFGDVSVCYEGEPLVVRVAADPAATDPDIEDTLDQQAFQTSFTVDIDGTEFAVTNEGDMTVREVRDALADAVSDSNVPVEVQKFGTEVHITPDQRYVTPGRPMHMEAESGIEDAITATPPCELRELWVVRTPFGQEICDPNIHDPDDCFQYTHDMFTRFGFFRTNRYFYDRENGLTTEGREQLINRWHIWEKSRYSDGQPIPYEDRTPKPIVYYLNVGFPESLMDAVDAQSEDWNIAFLKTIADLQGKTVEQVEEDYGDGPDAPFQAYEVRENDCNPENLANYIETHRGVRDLGADLMTHGLDVDDLGAGNLETACSVVEHYSKEAGIVPAFHWQQLGDLRYSFINWVATPEPAGPLGYGPSAADPVTGEIISGNANIYGASLDTYANWGGDIVDMLNDRIDIDDVVNGTHIREYVEQVRARAAQPVDRQVGQEMMHLFDERTAHLSDDEYLPRIPTSALNSTLDRVRESGFEREHLLTDEQIRLFGGSVQGPDGQFDEKAIQRALASSWGRASVPPSMRANAPLYEVMEKGSEGLVRNFFEEHQDRLDAYGRESFCYFVEDVEPAVADLAFDLKDKSREQAVQIIRHNIMRGVLAHEVGHTVGLRHNFEGSADPLNFFPGYWGVDTGDHRVSDNDRTEELAYSSIMDYHQRFNGDFGGLGLYDKAAIKFGYGGLIEVFDETNESFIPRDWANSFFLFYPDDLPYVMAGGDANQLINDKYDEVIDELYYEGNNEGFMNVKDLGIEPKPENLFKRRNVTFNEWRRQDVKRFFGDTNQDGTPLLIDVPYGYCSDSFAWGGNLTCNRFDKGATSQEIVANATEMYEFYYPFYTYMGAKVERLTSPWYNSWLSRLQSRFLQPLRNAFTYFYYYRRSTAQIWPFIVDWSIASHEGLNHLASIIQRPEPGTYCLDDAMYVPEGDLAEGQACDQPVELGLGEGRDYRTTYTDEYIFRVRNVGHIWDKILALNMITSNDAFFYRDFSNQVDRSAFSISYYRVFQEELLDLFSGMIMDDRSRFAPQLNVDTGEVVFNPLVSFRGQQPQPSVGPMIKPSANYTLSNYALFWGMTGCTSPLDQTLDFAQRAKISIVGEANDPVFDAPEMVFTDPKSGIQYHSFATDGEELSLGYMLLEDAQTYAETTWADAKAELESAEANQDTDPETYQQAQEAFSKIDREMNEKVHMIDLTRYLTRVLESSNG